MQNKVYEMELGGRTLTVAVSYTHLDVYKRQDTNRFGDGGFRL